MATITKHPLDGLTVAQLVRAAQDGDREAFGQLASRFERAVYSIVVRRTSNAAEAQELTQEVLVQALQRLHQLRAPERFGGWLRSIAVRMAINLATRRKPVVVTEPAKMEATCAASTTPLEIVMRQERAALVRAGLDRLRPLDRDTLVAFYLRGSSLVEMSHQFDSPVGTIKRRLHVARRRLAQQLGSPQG